MFRQKVGNLECRIIGRIIRFAEWRQIVNTRKWHKAKWGTDPEKVIKYRDRALFWRQYKHELFEHCFDIVGGAN